MKTNTFFVNFLYIFILLLVFSCKKDDAIGPVKTGTDTEDDDTTTTSSGKYASGVFVLNEGNFQWGNASVTYYNPENKTTEQEVFSNVNDRALGDVLQSMTIHNDKGYLIVDNSHKIEIVDANTFESIATIDNVDSPRYMAVINSNRAYVTSIWSNNIHVIDLNSNSVIKDIYCPGWTEQLALAEGKAFVTNAYRKYVYVVGTTTDALEDSIKVNYGPGSIQKDKNGKLWVLCGGDDSNNIVPALHTIDPITFSVEKTFTFTSDDHPGKLQINGSGDVLYYLNSGVYKLSISASSLPQQPFINGSYYGLGIDPQTGDIYASDAVDYVQNGWIYRYDPANGAEKDKFQTDIIPGGFAFN